MLNQVPPHQLCLIPRPASNAKFCFCHASKLPSPNSALSPTLRSRRTLPNSTSALSTSAQGRSSLRVGLDLVFGESGREDEGGLLLCFQAGPPVHPSFHPLPFGLRVPISANRVLAMVQLNRPPIRKKHI